MSGWKYVVASNVIPSSFDAAGTVWDPPPIEHVLNTLLAEGYEVKFILPRSGERFDVIAIKSND